MIGIQTAKDKPTTTTNTTLTVDCKTTTTNTTLTMGAAWKFMCALHFTPPHSCCHTLTMGAAWKFMGASGRHMGVEHNVADFKTALLNPATASTLPAGTLCGDGCGGMNEVGAQANASALPAGTLCRDGGINEV